MWEFPVGVRDVTGVLSSVKSGILDNELRNRIEVTREGFMEEAAFTLPF